MSETRGRAASATHTPPPYWRTLGALGRKDAAAVLGVSPELLDRMRRKGEIEGLRVGGRVVIPTREILRLLGEDDGRQPAGTPTPSRPALPRRLRKLVDEALDHAR